MKLIDKKKSNAFRKDIYLLGQFDDGKYFWLEGAKWDCSWYWGFGYIETYTNNSCPSKSRDISSHQHYDGTFFGKSESYDSEKGCFRLNSEYKHTIKDNKDVVACTLTEKEQWELADLMKTFYTLKDTAALYHQGNSHLTSNQRLSFEDKDAEKNINKVLLPKLFARVYEILTPDPNDKEGLNKSY